ncbi:MAG: hypothetical protein K0U41_06935 [Gammaproteobacteria bacterium]|nr:hypothetical protein [Gammaproteobacteria bacterium]
MEVLVFKMCYNLHFGSQKELGVILYEIDHPIRELISKGHQVTVCTIRRYHKYAFGGVNCITWEELPKKINSFDCAVVFNGPLNCYGGKVSEPALQSYRFLNQFNKPLFFCVTDTAIPIGNLNKWILSKQDKGLYTELNADDYTFNPKKIQCLTQTHDISKFMNHWDKETNGFGSYKHFPLHMYAMKKDNLHTEINNQPTRDLIYYGNQRSGKRNKKFQEFFCDQIDLTVDIYGKWKEADIKKMSPIQMPNLLGPIDTRDLNKEINSALATVYISDKFNEDCIWTTRFYEAIMNRTIMFVDIDNDPEKKIFDDFFYVQSKEELYKKVKLLKSDPSARVKLLNNQMLAIRTHIEEFNRFPEYWDTIIKGAQDGLLIQGKK